MDRGSRGETLVMSRSSKYVREKGMELSTKKSKVMVFERRRVKRQRKEWRLKGNW